MTDACCSHNDTGRVCAKYFVWSGTGMEQVWNGYGTDAQLNITDFSGIAFDGLERRGLERNSGT